MDFDYVAEFARKNENADTEAPAGSRRAYIPCQIRQLALPDQASMLVTNRHDECFSITKQDHFMIIQSGQNSGLAGDSTPPHDGSIEEDIRLLRKQVDILQIASAEKNRPWYRTSANLISVLAILFSGLTFVYSQHFETVKENIAEKESLLNILSKILELQSDFSNRVALIQNPSQRMAESTSLNSKMLIYVDSAEELANKIPNEVSSAEYGILAYQLQLQVNFSQAEKYYRKAIDSSRTPLEKIIALRSLALLYFSMRNYEQGRKYFGAAVATLQNPTDPYLIYTVGETYRVWGVTELFNGFLDGGRLEIDRARKYLADLPLNYPLRANLNDEINKASVEAAAMQNANGTSSGQ